MNLKYTDDKIIEDLKFIYEKYQSLSTSVIKKSSKEYNTIPEHIIRDRVGTEKYRCEKLGVPYINTKISFYEWCVENNRMECIEQWDYKRNKLKPTEISYGSRKNFWFICKECGCSREYTINSITSHNVQINLCYYCNSFWKWCIDNNHQDYLDRWDYDKNIVDPKELSYGNMQKIYLKCPRGIHDSQLYCTKTLTSNATNARCNKCFSFAQWGIDVFGNDFLEKYWDYDKNMEDPFEIAVRNNFKTIWLKCQDKDYHGTYKTKPCIASRYKDKILCPYCTNIRLHKFDSLGYVHPEVFNIWSDKNDTSPYDYKPQSDKQVWFKCPNGKHTDVYKHISDMRECHFECIECNRESYESRLQRLVRTYIDNKYGYKLLHEQYCTIVPRNPKTNFPLHYDNEVVDLKLIIEVHGQQHYMITGFAHLHAKERNITAEEAFANLQFRDKYKKEYALEQGYYYLEIPYWTEDDESYKELIDNKIDKILSKQPNY